MYISYVDYFLFWERKNSPHSHTLRVCSTLVKKAPPEAGRVGVGVGGGPIPPRKWPLHVLFLFHFVIFIKIWEEDLDKDKILD